MRICCMLALFTALLAQPIPARSHFQKASSNPLTDDPTSLFYHSLFDLPDSATLADSVRALRLPASRGRHYVYFTGTIVEMEPLSKACFPLCYEPDSDRLLPRSTCMPSSCRSRSTQSWAVNAPVSPSRQSRKQPAGPTIQGPLAESPSSCIRERESRGSCCGQRIRGWAICPPCTALRSSSSRLHVTLIDWTTSGTSSSIFIAAWERRACSWATKHGARLAACGARRSRTPTNPRACAPCSSSARRGQPLRA